MLPGHRLRALLLRHGRAGTNAAMPGAFNGLVARAVAQEGFHAAYISGAGVSASMGLPDIGLAGLEDFCRIIRDVATCSGLPVLADADTGFGEVEAIARVVSEYSRAGAAGFHIEDQVFPKRCGHLDGKALVPAEDFALKVLAAARARDDLGGSFVVCARTDARGVEGLSSVVERAKRYVDAGADMVFPEGLASEAEFRHVAEAMRGYNGINDGQGPFLLANMTEFGKTPVIPVDTFAALGYHCTIFPMTLFRMAMAGVRRGLADLRTHGRITDPHLEDPTHMLTRQQTYELLHYTPSVPWTYPSSSSSSHHGGHVADAASSSSCAGDPRAAAAGSRASQHPAATAGGDQATRPPTVAPAGV